MTGPAKPSYFIREFVAAIKKLPERELTPPVPGHNGPASKRFYSAFAYRGW
jgi:hypothetical protein